MRAALIKLAALGLMLCAAGDVLNGNVTPAPDRVPFAGGHSPFTHAWSRFHVRYYAMALLFLVFDMEMVFMYPWTVGGRLRREPDPVPPSPSRSAHLPRRAA